MKAVCVLALLLMFMTATTANAQSKKLPDSVNVLIRLHPRDAQNPLVDSVLVIFDRFDRTGAGIVKRIYHPIDNQFTIFKVPEGKYYINIFCLGFYRDTFNDLMFVSKRHSNNLRYKLKRNDEFTPGTYLPDMEVDFANLAITNIKSFR
ncbi:hypothetical protein A4H97_13720 [Niastella yeongjuensis]|uniref:DUF2141 domain-containing protein n=1 Tax=Niastella yeongjuensis TaxID=354355 RepID=A0A1V9EAR2_9BACT|nr:hypothetical protein [Niastella yeongjuensis]OQP43186.1 hypothetical protein A4H97_13720 [Niastella yeongjuensis]SEO69777.1 hypothetical protein SAMN05660816_03414 [Niastella yeongjuensis]